MSGPQILDNGQIAHEKCPGCGWRLPRDITTGLPQGIAAPYVTISFRCPGCGGTFENTLRPGSHVPEPKGRIILA